MYIMVLDPSDYFAGTNFSAFIYFSKLNLFSVLRANRHVGLNQAGLLETYS